MELNKIYQGNALDVLKTWPDESISCVMTSPPYWGLRDYGEDTSVIWGGDSQCEHEWGNKIEPRGSKSGKPGPNATVGARFAEDEVRRGEGSNFCLKCGAWKGQLGLEPDFNDYIRHLCDIFDEIKRVLRKDGTCWVNLGDTYGTHCSGGKEHPHNFQDASTAREQGIGTLKKPKGIEKSLCLVPFRFAIEMVNRGWILRNTLVWHKPNCLPSSVKDRFTVDFEYLFFFTKNKKYWFETQYEPLQEITIKDKRVGCDVSRRGIKDYPNGIQNPSDVRARIFNNLNPLGRNKRTVWSICPQPFPDAHFAVFPEELCETPIKAGCPEFICKKCGTPREKIYERQASTMNIRVRDVKEGRIKFEDRKASDDEVENYGEETPQGEVKFKGYTDCGCDHSDGWDSGIVLDPFIGSGTVGLVALKQNKKFVGIELKPAYIEMAMKRLKPWLEQTRLSEFDG